MFKYLGNEKLTSSSCHSKTNKSDFLSGLSGSKMSPAIRKYMTNLASNLTSKTNITYSFTGITSHDKDKVYFTKNKK